MKKLITILIFIFILSGCQQEFGADVEKYPVGKITAPENNTFKIGVKNYQEEFKDNITDDKSLQYKLDDKYIAFKPLGMKWDTADFKTAVSSLKAEKKYSEVFGKGIDLEMKTGERVWSKIISINSLKDLGEIPKDTEYLNIEFALDTNFVIDGWDKNSKFEINNKVRIGDYSYLEPAMAWTSSSTLDRVQIKSYFEKGKYVKQIPVEFLKNAEYPIYTDADITYGTASAFDTNESQAIEVATIDDGKIAVCWADGGTVGTCKIATISGTTFSWGSASTFDSDVIVSNKKIGACKVATDKLATCWADDSLADDGFCRVVSVSGTTIGTWGTASRFLSSDVEYIDCSQLDTDKFVVCYNNETYSDTGGCSVLTTSGTTITYGSATYFDGGTTDYFSKYNSVSAINIGDNKFINCFSSSDDTKGYCVAATVSTRTITFGTVALFYTPSSYNRWNGVSSPASDQFALAYEFDNADGELLIGTVSGTTITYGNAITLNGGSAAWGADTVFNDATHFIASYQDQDDMDEKTRYCEATWATRSVSCNSEELVQDNSWTFINEKDINKVTDNKIVICFSDNDDSKIGKCIIGDIAAAPEPPATDSCTYSGSGDWNIVTSDNCYIESPVYVNGSCNFINDAYGTFGTTAEISCENIHVGTGFIIQTSGSGILSGRP